MRDWPATFMAELQRPGCNPYWLLVIVANGTTYYLSDNTRIIAPLGNAQAYGVIKEWGSLQGGNGNGTLAGYNVAEYTVQILAGLPIAATGTAISQLAAAGYLDEAQADIYLGLAGIADPPQLFSPGYIRDFGKRTDTVVPLIIQDSTILLEKAFVGRKVTSDVYPQAARNDVGKVIPIPFGTVNKIPALLLSGAVTTTLKTACTDTVGSLYLSDLSRITIGMTLLLDSEQVVVTGIGTYTASVTRHANGTTAAAHAKGCAVVQLADQIYAVADRAVTSLPKAWLRLSDELDLDISGSVNFYTGQAGNTLTGYANMAVVLLTAANMVSIAAMATLALKDEIEVNDANHLHTISGQNITQYAAGVGLTASGNSGVPVIVSNALSFPSLPGGTFIQQTIHFEIQFVGAKKIYFDGVLAYDGIPWTGSQSYDRTTTGSGSTTNVTVYGDNNTYTSVITNVCSRVVVYNASTSNNPAAVTKTGTVTLTGADVTNYFTSGKLFIDAISDNGIPSGMANWLLSQRSLPTIRTVGNLLTNSISGLISEYKTYLYWLNKLAFEVGSWFMLPGGQPKFISRQKTAPVATITECIADDKGVRSLSIGRTSLEDKLEKVTVLYCRDWSQSKSDTAYTASTPTATSGAGTRERPELFQFDFITDSLPALAAQTLYLATQGNRRDLPEFDAWIDQAGAVECGDTVQLWDGKTGIVLPAEHAPGSFERPDTVKLTVLI